ncbi:MASE1 domain-containing protein [Candidatus Peregrinibacteria bacterium]|nr:MASE1 domain-containing protein [Candidatus Peregrinibacteria bacterium]
MALLCVIYVVAGKLGLLLASFHTSASPVWPATGIAIASLLLLGPRYFPAILAGAFIVNVTTSGATLSSFFIAIGNTLEGVAGAYLIRHTARGSRAFDTVNGVLAFIACVFAAAFISASIGVTALLFGPSLARADVTAVWFTWMLGNAVGGLTITPLVVLWARERSTLWRIQVQRLPELAGLCAFTVLIAFGVFGNPFSSAIIRSPLAYLAFLPVLWAAIRFGSRQTMAVTFVISCIAVFGALRGSGPFAGGSVHTSLLFLQAFVGVMSFAGLSLAAALRERKASEESLERKVEERTRELAVARAKDQANVQRLRNMINHMTLAAIALDEHLVILQANDEFCRFFAPRSTPDRLMGQKLSTILEQRGELPLHVQMLQRLLSEGDRVLGYELALPAGGATLSCDYIPIRDQGIHCGHLLLCRDVTQEKRADGVKSEFVSLASHQLRTPLTKIRWAVSKLEKHLLPSDAQKLVSVAKNAAEVMADTIDVMLTISQMEAGKVDPRVTQIRLTPFFEALRRECELEYQERGQTFRCECPAGLALFTDQLLLREILLNLLRNAIKYTPRGGTITLRAFSDDQELRLEVEDTGIGIPVSERHRIFQKFFRAENALDLDQSGIGLGLYLVQMAADLLRARVTFDSEMERGTVFRLSFPPPPVSKLTELPVAPSVSQLSLGLEVGVGK